MTNLEQLQEQSARLARLPFIRQAVEHAATEIASLPPKRWPGWACYLLEYLDVTTDEETMREFLETVRRDIDRRLADGGW